MKNIFIIISILVLSSGIQAEVKKSEEKCDGATPQMSECLNNKIKIADSKLNETYNKIMSEIKDKKQSDLLKKSQQAWLNHMNKEIEFVSSYFSGGTYGGIRIGYLKLDFLEKRTHDLTELVKP